MDNRYNSNKGPENGWKVRLNSAGFVKTNRLWTEDDKQRLKFIMEESKNEVVVSGIAGRFPTARNVDEFWGCLIKGKEQRTTTTTCGNTSSRHLKNDIRKFDGDYFGLYPMINGDKQHVTINPYLTQLLEVSYEAILDSGTSPLTLRGKNVGVFVNSAPEGEYDNGIDSIAQKIATNFQFNGEFTSSNHSSGPSDSLQILHNALESIQDGGCDYALVTGINLVSSLGSDESQDAEAVVAIFLQKKYHARREYLTILQSRVSNKSSQQFLLDCYMNHNNGVQIDPSEITYLDLINSNSSAGQGQQCRNNCISELLNSIETVFNNENRDVTLNPLIVLSEDDEIINMKYVSGLVRLIKLVLAVQQDVNPAGTNVNSMADLFTNNSSALMQGDKGSKSKMKPGLIAIHGTSENSINYHQLHIILKPSPRISQRIISANPVIIPISGRTKQSILDVMQKIVCSHRNFQFDSLLQKIAEESSDANAHAFRGYLIRGDAVFTDTKESPKEKMPLWFIFSGTPTSLYPGMLNDLIQIEVFANSIRRSTEILNPFGIDLYEILMHGDESLLDRYLGTGYIAMGIAYIDMLKTLGIEPDGYIGHSGGELLCAYLDGCLTHEEALIGYYWKDELVQKCLGGTMASIALTWEKAKAKCPPWIYPACHNSTNNVTISGLSKDVIKFLDELKAEGILGVEVSSGGVAYHSRYLKPMLAEFESKLKDLIKTNQPRSKKWICTSIPEKDWNKSSVLQQNMVTFLVNNIKDPVLFQPALKHIPRGSTVVEITPNAHMTTMLEKSLPKTCAVLWFQRKGNGNNAVQMLTGLGKLYENGVNPKISELYRGITNFPVSVGTQMISPLVSWNHSVDYQVPSQFMR